MAMSPLRAHRTLMELNQLHQEVDDKLSKINAEIQRFQSNIKTCDDAEQCAVLEQDLATLKTIREKLLKAKQVTQQVSDLRTRVENPVSKSPAMAGLTLVGLTLLVASVGGLLLWWMTAV